MKPLITRSNTKDIFIDDTQINYDFLIDSGGEIQKRIPIFSEAVNASSSISLEEAYKLFDPNVNEIIIGSPANDRLKLSHEATDFFEEKRCKIKSLPVDEAITYWNRYEGHAMALFHISD